MRSRNIIIIVLVIGLSIFVYSQYLSVSQINATIIHNQPVENAQGSMHNIELEFNNPSLLVLTAGETQFSIISEEKIIGNGSLQSFVLPPLGKSSASGTYLKDSNIDSKDNSIVKISGFTKYNVFFTTIDVPFLFYPTPEQAREFIQQN